ncbi:ATP-binding protein [Mitsuaria sp. GD03876]|uniref:sensor histidine kinase n=1 Tax=Mitsuaria sp. GD03876 TaxID=2975399 RepID=UPI0024492EC9|nr:ATP-binding protein [Mitsuaria sp. GD03876]MDH0866620.1 ATP-binding protein [Mitsuaria sp. GD03876]
MFSQAINGADVYLNDVWLDGFAQSRQDARFMWFRPLVAELPPRLLRRDGPNIVTVEITSWEPYFTIAPIHIGPSQEASYVAESIDFLARTLANASRGFCLLAGVFMVGVWLANRRDPVYGLLGAAALTWAAVYTLSLWIYMPAHWRPLWLWAFYLCAGGLNVLLVQFILRYVDRPLSRRALGTLVAISAVAATVWPFLGAVVELNLDMFWIWVLMPFQAWAVAQLARHAWRTRSTDAMLLLVVVVLAGALILHDYNVLMQLVRWRVDPDDWNLVRLLTAPIYLTHLALPPLLIVMARVHLSKYRQSLEHVRQANHILAESLRRREMELAVSYSRQSDLERREAAQDERERIYSELHDGIGSRLVTTIFSVREGRLDRQQLERGLLDVLQGVRDVISETDTTEHREIQDILFDYCLNLDSLLSAPDFQIEYEIENGRECVLLGELSKDVMRVVEESVANTLKYAQSTRLSIALRQDDACLTLTVEDNGDAAAGASSAVRPAFGASTGHGLANMKERARRMGGDYRFERGPAGARTTLTLPLAALPPGPDRSRPDTPSDAPDFTRHSLS